MLPDHLGRELGHAAVRHAVELFPDRELATLTWVAEARVPQVLPLRLPGPGAEGFDELEGIDALIDGVAIPRDGVRCCVHAGLGVLAVAALGPQGREDTLQAKFAEADNRRASAEDMRSGPTQRWLRTPTRADPALPGRRSLQAGERAEIEGGLPKFVVDEFEAHLACRRCGESMLVGFSCKKRGFCPACLGRRMFDIVAAHLVDEILHVPPSATRRAYLERLAAINRERAKGSA